VNAFGGSAAVASIRVVKERSEGLAPAAAELYAHGPVLLAAARAMTVDDADAEDLVQATFEIAIRSLTSLRDPAAMRFWLLRIEVREAMRITRRMRRFVRFDAHVREIPHTDPALADRVALKQALTSLPIRVRAAVALHHLAGLSVRQTAEALGVSENTVKSELKVGLARLREELADD
jgi:RNA polymerase sigma factor (sigma-70 family)